MLLRRVTEHLKAQNWTAVALDFVIVVMGVFIGIQVSNWNDGLADRAREAQAIEGLREDFRQLDIRVQRAVAFHERAFAGLQVVVKSLERGELPDSDRRQFEDGLRYGYRTAAVVAVSSTLAELTSTGQISLLRDPELRKALTEYELFLESARQGHRKVRSAVVLYTADFTARFDYDVDSNRPGTHEESAWAFKLSEIGDYDFEAMRNDDAFKDAVYELREFQLFDLNWHLNTLERIEDIRRLLGDELPDREQPDATTPR